MTVHIIKDSGDKIKPLLSSLKEREKEISIVVIILATAAIGYGLGRLSKIEELKPPVAIIPPSAEWQMEERGTASVVKSAAKPTSLSGKIVASRNSTKYHLLHCSGANSIKEENKIFFDSEEAARAAGYVRAANCK